MSNSYIIDNTAGSTSFIIEPGTLDGPGGVNRNSDLYLYGQGSIKWGEGVSENLLRIAESFACPQKVLGDFLPGGLDGNTDYDPSIHNIMPKDETDLGATGLGITTPVNGQLWYNTTTNKLYVYDLINDAWNTSSGLYIDSDPASAVIGDLKYDSDFHGVGVGQLLIHDGSNFVSTAEQYVELAGDDGALGNAMTGRLTLSSDPVNPLHAVTKQYADTTFIDAAGDTMSGALDMDSNTITNPADPTTDDHVGDRGYNDNRYLERSGVNPMAADLSMGTNNITNVVDPVNPQDAATKNYIDTALSTLFSGLYPVGSIFIGANPQSFLNALGLTTTWSQVSAGTFLMAEGDGSSGAAGATGGTNSKTLSWSNMPAHTHNKGTMRIQGSISYIVQTQDGYGSVSTSGALSWSQYNVNSDGGESWRVGGTIGLDTNSGGWTGNTGSAGSGTAFDNRPQYQIVEMWKRIA